MENIQKVYNTLKREKEGKEKFKSQLEERCNELQNEINDLDLQLLELKNQFPDLE